MRRAVTPRGLLAALLLIGCARDQEKARQEQPQTEVAAAPELEGKAVNGLRLEAAAKFVPEEDGWGSPKLEQTFTFRNETGQVIVLDAHTMRRPVLSRVSPPSAVEARREERLDYRCFPTPPGPSHLVRIPAHGEHVIKDWTWFGSLSIPPRGGDGGEAASGALRSFEYFDLVRPGPLTLAFVYRSGGPNSAATELSRFLKPGEALWSGEVYSNPVTINVSSLHRQQPPPRNYTGVWTYRYPSGRPERVAHFKDGKLDGTLVKYSPRGIKDAEHHYRGGVRHGPYITYDEEGRKTFQQTYHEGKCVGVMSWWHPNGRKKAEKEVREGFASGRYTEWYESGRKKLEGTYHSGEKHGTWTEWDEKGNVVAVKSY